MRVTVRCFSTVRERVGATELALDVPAGATLADVVGRVSSRTASAAVLREWLASGHLQVARNRTHAPAGALVHDGDEVALFPPVTGG